MEAAPPGFIVKRGVRGKTVVDVERSTSLTSQPSLPSVSAVATAADDAPCEKLLGMTASVVNFQRRCEWFYVDPSGEEHGPVQLQKIINWHKKGHFSDDVKVRCRSPWFTVGPLAKAVDEAAEADTPTSARAFGGSSASHGGGSDAGAFFATGPPPPPPPPRPAVSVPGSWSGAADGSSYGSSVAAPGSYDAELKALFAGDVTYGNETVWYYIDRSDQLQGPFSAQEMIAWVGNGMLKEDTQMCGADASLAIPPGRNMFLPLSELLLSIRRCEPNRPAHLELLRRKASVSGAGGVLQPPPPPPPRRADSSGASTADGSSVFGPPGRGSDAPTWRKDIPAPATAAASSNAAQSTSSAAGARVGSSSAAADSTTTDGSSKAAEAKMEAAAAAAAAESGSVAANSSEDKAAEYHSSNAAALDVVLAPESDFEYGEDFKKQRQARGAVHVPGGLASGSGNKDGAGEVRGRPVQNTDYGGSQQPPQMAAYGNAGSTIAHPGALLLRASQQQQLLQSAAQHCINLTPEQLQQMMARAQQHQQVQAAAAAQPQAAAMAAAALPRLASGCQTASGSQGLPATLLGAQSGFGNMASMGLPASAPIAFSTAAGSASGMQMLPAGIASLLNLQLQQQQQTRAQDGATGNSQAPMPMNMLMAAQQMQQRMTQPEQKAQQPQPIQQQLLPGQQALTVQVPAGLQPTLQQMIQAGQGAQVQALLQQLSAAAPQVSGHQQVAANQQQVPPSLPQQQQQQQQHGHQDQAAVAPAATQQLSASQQVQQMQQHMQQLAIMQQQQRQHICMAATQAGTTSNAALSSAPGPTSMPHIAAPQPGRP